MTDEIQDLFEHIGQLAIDSVPTDEWDTIKIEIKAVRSFVERTVIYSHHEKTPEPKTFGIKDKELEYDTRITPSFERLRQLMYDEAPFRGAWYTAVMTITPDGKFETEFDYEQKPAFDYEASAEEYSVDFEHFPRNEKSTPEWLKEIVQQFGLSYHEPEPLS
ncbi:immunity protein YezG family protein [Hymenobacter cellulosilyticus]|uniref:DUF600 family protein n=1 Tax=Hymenobacter cellulosilyticus TaxID=2932248 RepID=A0A8T9QJ43_9BACT|nr:immunity protein YezG family protein [Hymenobacter cellulosilyticus]UOQ74803.1 DUF600 family protein [Hymenobacter cellulosilyticus]